ncbi:MAG: glycosyltransferase family 4 protein [Oscillospiraceae bacterium]|nr:glycosyltransferase family 4 protein [Oscillospiraceae bacterium]
MLKVLNVISDSNIGGAGKMLLAFLQNCDKTKLDMTVVVPQGALLIEALKEMNVHFLTVEGLAEKSFSVPVVRRLKKLIIAEKPDIVHTHASMSARIAARLAGCKIVYTRHSVFPNSPMKIRFPLKQIFGAVNNYFADEVIAVSPAAKDIIVEAGQKPGKVKVIYNGVDALSKPGELERAAARAVYGLGAEDFVCGIFARLTPVKGHAYVLKAAELLKNNADIKFVIAGTGEIEDELKKRAVGNGLDNVVFTGFLSDVETLMGALDLQLNASYGTEATSLALLEGMSMGIPAVASSFGGNPYVIAHGENGMIFPEKDAEALAEAIRVLYADSDLYKEMSDNSVKIFNEQFTSAEMTKHIEALYHSL